jgi:hypothetical protein
VTFNSTTFNGTAYFSSSTYNGDAYFEGPNFNGTVDFGSSTFEGDAYFRGSTFNGTAYFGDSEFYGTAYFGSSTYNGDAYFRGSTFNGTAYFGSSTYNGDAYFEGSTFNGTAFVYSTFNGAADFGGLGFYPKGDPDFGDPVLKGDTTIERIFWMSSGSTFEGDADFRGSIFNGTVDFVYSTFEGDADFVYSTFEGDADFRGSTFEGDADFSSSTYNGIADFSSSTYNGIADFSSSTYKDNVFYYDTSFKQKINFKLTEYEKLYIRWDNYHRLIYDDAAYQLLIENLRKLGFMADADNCYYQFRVDQFLHQNPIEDPLIYLFNFGAWVFYGYGKRPIYPFLWSILSIGLFGVFWIAVGLQNPRDAVNKFRLDKRWPHMISSSFLLLLVTLIKIIWKAVDLDKTIRVIDEYDHVRNWPSSLSEGISFSATVFLSGTKFFVDPPVVPALPGRSQSLIKRAFLFERLLGAFFSILLFLAIGATVVR